MLKLKALGPPLLAVLAAMAFAAPAQANEPANFWSESEHIDAQLGDEHGAHLFAANFGTVTCTKVSGTATLPNESGALESDVVSYETCHIVTFGITFPVTVTMNGCDYLFTAGTQVNPDLAEGSVHIADCDSGESITIDVYQAGTEANEHGSPAKRHCQIHVPEQTIGGLRYHNGKTEGVDGVTVELKGLEVEETVTDFNNAGCNNHLTDTFVYTGSFWAKGTDAEENYVDTTVTAEP